MAKPIPINNWRGDPAVIARQRDGHAGQNHRDAEKLRTRQHRAEPEPFDQDGEGRDEALREQHGAAAAKPGQRLEKSGVAEADAEESAHDEKRQRRTRQVRRQKGAPTAREKKQRGGNAPEVGLRAADLTRTAVAAYGGDGEQERG